MVRGGIVTLSGEVDSLAKRVMIGRAVEGMHGLRSMVNDIRVRLPEVLRRSDADLACDVMNALMAEPAIPDNTINARVQDGWVWLVGEADGNHQLRAAELAVETIAGIKGLTNVVHAKRSSR